MSPSTFWLTVGIVLLALELLVPLPTLLFAGALGLAALTIAILAIAPVPIFLQVVGWLVVSGLLVWYSRRFVPKGTWQLKDASEGVAITEIPAGQSGRVRYEGNSWKARCDDPKVEIQANEKVYVLRKQGTTLIVVPEHWLNEHKH